MKDNMKEMITIGYTSKIMEQAIRHLARKNPIWERIGKIYYACPNTNKELNKKKQMFWKWISNGNGQHLNVV